MNAKSGPSKVTVALGVLGELLITAGLLIFLFIIWQVWWTDIGARAEQDRIVTAFQDTAPPLPEKVIEPDQVQDYGDPPVLDRASLTVDTNDLWGVMHIPAFGDDFQVGIAEGVSLADVLDKGSLGHYPQTQLPGELGNVALAGHRQTYGAPLKNQPDLVEGDPLVIETRDAWYVYKVTGHEVVLPSQIDVIAPVPGHPDETPTESMLTLTTCHPPFVSNERWITYAQLDYWIPRDAGVPKELG